jgi:hypothetical protein
MHNTRIRSTLHPGQKGAKQLHAQYGDRLVCVRYRYDAQRKKRYKTVELIVAEGVWRPRRSPAPTRLVGVRVPVSDAALRRRVKSAGGRWDARRRVWKLRYDRAVASDMTSAVK